MQEKKKNQEQMEYTGNKSKMADLNPVGRLAAGGARWGHGLAREAGVIGASPSLLLLALGTAPAFHSKQNFDFPVLGQSPEGLTEA